MYGIHCKTHSLNTWDTLQDPLAEHVVMLRLVRVALGNQVCLGNGGLIQSVLRTHQKRVKPYALSSSVLPARQKIWSCQHTKSVGPGSTRSTSSQAASTPKAWQATKSACTMPPLCMGGTGIQCACGPHHASRLIMPHHASSCKPPHHASSCLIMQTASSCLIMPHHANRLNMPHHASRLIMPHHASSCKPPYHASSCKSPHHAPSCLIMQTAPSCKPPHHANRLIMPHHANRLIMPHHANRLNMPHHANRLIMPHHASRLIMPHHANRKQAQQWHTAHALIPRWQTSSWHCGPSQPQALLLLPMPTSTK